MATEQRAENPHPVEDQLDVEVRAAMQAYGDGEIDAAEAAEQVRPAYGYALALRNADETDDTTAEPHAFLEVALARQTGVISMEQYAELVEALQQAPQRDEQ